MYLLRPRVKNTEVDLLVIWVVKTLDQVKVLRTRIYVSNTPNIMCLDVTGVFTNTTSLCCLMRKELQYMIFFLILFNLEC